MFVTQIQENLLIDTIEHDKNMQNIENRLISVRHSCFVKNKSERIEVFGKSIFFLIYLKLSFLLINFAYDF